MRSLRACFAAIALLGAITTTAALAENVVVINDSDWALVHFYLSPVDEAEWGPDQLGEEVVGSGDTFTLTGIPCASYDVRLVDEEGDECIVGDVAICSGDEGWHITSEDLAACEGY
jgi:hypothetical protein